MKPRQRRMRQRGAAGGDSALDVGRDGRRRDGDAIKRGFSSFARQPSFPKLADEAREHVEQQDAR